MLPCYALAVTPNSGANVNNPNNVPVVKHDDKVIVSIRPEEFYISDEKENALKTKILSKTFLGKYINYSLYFEKDEILDNQSSIEYSQSSSSDEKVYDIGETIYLKPNIKKINIFNINGISIMNRD